MAHRNPIAKSLRIMGKPQRIEDKREAIKRKLMDREGEVNSL